MVFHPQCARSGRISQRQAPYPVRYKSARHTTCEQLNTGGARLSCIAILSTNSHECALSRSFSNRTHCACTTAHQANSAQPSCSSTAEYDLTVWVFPEVLVHIFLHRGCVARNFALLSRIPDCYADLRGRVALRWEAARPSQIRADAGAILYTERKMSSVGSSTRTK